MSLNESPLSVNIKNSQENLNNDKIASLVDDFDHVNREDLEVVRCFVCDAQVQGRRYALATCKTQCTRTRVIEKLGELVGERYVVVISEDDAICRICANLINKLDRLESETKNIKSSVLRFLERKYSLAEGELSNSNNVPKLGQPPQITKSNSQKLNYHSRKRAPVTLEDFSCTEHTSKKSNVWMQCDKCHYTTTSNTFVANHAGQNKKKKVSCDKCHLIFPFSQLTNHNCKVTANEVPTGIENPNEVRAIQTAPLETIDLTGTSEDADEDTSPVPVVSLPSSSDPLQSKDEQLQLFSLNANPLQFQTIIANDTSLRDGQPLFMRVFQQFGVNEDLGQANLIPVAGNDTVKAKETTKQILTLAEDGTLEMVAVECWNDDNQTVQNPEVAL